MRFNFDTSFEKLIGHEGGYVNDPYDAGGETNYGISKRSYPNEDIKGMTLGRAKVIYKRDYWDKVKGDDLPSGIDHVAFDGAVNSGVSRGAKWVQAAAGANADGVIGPASLVAINSSNPVDVINDALNARLDFMRGLGVWSRFKNGWTTRINNVRREALGMVVAPAVDNHTPVDKPVGFWAFIMGLLK